MLEELRRVALFTSGVAELTRHRAEQIVKDLVRNGDVRRDKASSTVKDLLSVSKQSRQELLRMIRSEIKNQVMSLGVASTRDLERLERRIARLEAGSAKASTRSTAKGPASAGSTSKTTAKKSSKTTARSTAGRKATGTKSASKPAGSPGSTS